MNEVRIGIIGMGRWGPNLVSSFAAQRAARIAALCDSQFDRLEPFRERYPGARLLGDWRRIIDDAGLDAVAIATPTCTHYEIARAALEAGKHVFVEKPLATDYRQAEELRLLALRRGLKLMVGHVFLYNPAVSFIREALRRGALGQLCYLSFTRENLGPVRSDVGALWDLAPHDISMLLHFLGASPLDVSAQGAAYLSPPIEDVVFATLRFAQGIVANIRVSWLAPKKDRRVLIVGTERMLLFDDLQTKAPIRIFTHADECFTPEIPLEEPLRNECLAFVDCILEGTDPLSDGGLGVEVVRVLESVSRSMGAGGAPIPVGPAPLPDDLPNSHPIGIVAGCGQFPLES